MFLLAIIRAVRAEIIEFFAAIIGGSKDHIWETTTVIMLFFLVRIRTMAAGKKVLLPFDKKKVFEKKKNVVTRKKGR